MRYLLECPLLNFSTLEGELVSCYNLVSLRISLYLLELNMYFPLTTGEVDWEISAQVGRSCSSGRYATPLGWELRANLPKNRYLDRGGEYRKEQTVGMFLREAVSGGS
jgi:hypothetical protein